MKSNTYIKRMMFSYLPILFLTISILISIFVTIINELNVRNAIQANKVTTEYISNMIDNSLKTIDADARKVIETNAELQAFLDTPSDRLLSYAASNILSEMMVQHNFIDSIYFYRTKDSKVLDQSTIRSIDEFPDRAYILELLKQPYPVNWSSPRVKNGSNKTNLKVITLGRKVPLDTGSLGYMIINVNLEAIGKFVDGMIDRTVTNAQIYDAGHQPFFPDIAFDSQDQSVHAAVTSDYSGWTYQTGIKGGRLYSILLHGNAVWIVAVLGAIALAIGSTFYVTRRSYRPIEAILHRIDRFSHSFMSHDLKSDKNEFAFIDHAIERLITNNMAFQEKQVEHLAIRRQQFLQNLLNGEYAEDQEVWRLESEHYGIQPDTRFIVALLEIDHYVQFGTTYNQKDQSLFKFVISSVAVEFAEQNQQQVMMEWISKNRLVLLHISHEDQDPEHHLLKLAEHIRSWIEAHLDFTVTFGVGGVAEDVALIRRSYQEAGRAVNRKVTLGINQIIDTVEDNETLSDEWFTYLQLIQTVVRQIRMSEAGWPDAFAKLFHEMRVQRLQREDIERLLQYFVFQMERELEGIQPEMDAYWKNGLKLELMQGLEHSETLQQIETCFRLVLEQMAVRLSELSQNRRHHALMREIRSYVAENFTDPNLSLTLLSDRFQINSKYLSQLFKEELGENFSDLLISLRMEFAKKLLVETMETVQDISVRVGYTNSISFSRIFKKCVGLSPGQFRESQLS
ncbi:helix-turn-helix domain-containing protein [Paenibacillus sp. GCM10023248]|uniref:helix-turn-helix domain-containing protein n=1 Tax=Bacillales TaxID=1385 RepID=UPI002377D2E5|nr:MULTISPECIES: helix-turn-helix domain-containing protein [Bacillales]MDD9269243.1 helix-turn-helix domain-containing protein [Paenibacillus sp. MAHUQ-63]MDR6880535.1 YesN/AraC family two-component response regulator [Bacillus sp. 3255]